MNEIARKRKTEWQRNQRRQFAARNGFSTRAHYHVGCIRKQVLERDNYRCVVCSMTAGEHTSLFGRPITIDHKDRNKKNNKIENLQTLCLSCHGRKDILPRLINKKFEKFLSDAIAMREMGKTYQFIADNFKVSIATVWKYLKKGDNNE